MIDFMSIKNRCICFAKQKSTQYLSLIITFFLVFEQMVWSIESFANQMHSISSYNHSFIQQHKTPYKQVNLGQTYKKKLHSFATSPKTHLPVLANGQAAIPSNANNFHGGGNASVDPRTGRSSFTVTIASMIFDHGFARRELKLSYGGSSTPSQASPFYMGSQWSWNVGIEHLSATEIAGHQTTDITLSDGHSFTMEKSQNSLGKPIWNIYRHKLKDVLIMGHPGDWTIATSNGLREHLKNGYEDWEEGENGKRVWLYYDHNEQKDTARHLRYICSHPLTVQQLKDTRNACDAGIMLSYKDNRIIVHGHQHIILTKKTIGGLTQISKLTMPSLSSFGISNAEQNAELKFSYDVQGGFPWLLHRIDYPNGATSTFYYNTETGQYAAKTKGLLVGGYRGTIPVVTELMNHDRFAPKTDLHTWYRYEVNRHDQHNYTGYQSSQLMIPGRDNLADQSDNYTYSVTQDDGLISKTTTYNKYHLPLRELVVSDTTHHVIGETENQYHDWKNTTFAQLKPGYSLPIGSSKVFYTSKAEGLQASHRVINETRYNENGQPIWKRDDLGGQTFIQYCGKTANKHCTAAVSGWPLLSLPEKILWVPPKTNQVNAENSQHAIVTEFDYTQLKIALNNRTYMMKKGLRNVDHQSVLTQIKRKTEGYLPIEMTTHLHPGEPIPELQSNQVSLQTMYQYIHNSKAQDYGQIKLVTMVKYPESLPEIQHRLLNLSYLNDGKRNRKKEVLTIKIIRKTNAVKQERKIITMIDQNHSSALGSKKSQRMLAADSISLGEKVYSIETGIKLSENDPLKTVHTSWVYDVWMRPVKQVVNLAYGGHPKEVTWTYINTDRENSVVTTHPNGNQEKHVVNNRMQEISSWYRFKGYQKHSLEGFTGWIKKSSAAYDGFGGLKSHVTNYITGNHGIRIPITTRYGYDETKRPVWVATQDGQVNVTFHDDANMRIYMYHVVSDKRHHTKLGCLLKVADANLRGQPISTYILPLNPKVKRSENYLYSKALQRTLLDLRRSLHSVNSLTTVNSSGLLSPEKVMSFGESVLKSKAWFTRSEFVYDSAGRKIKQIMGNGATTQWIWDHKGNLVATITPDHRMIHDEYNLQGDKTARCVYAKGSHVCHPLGYRNYDDSGELVKQVNETGQAIKYHYDDDGRVILKELPAAGIHQKSHLITFKYNSIGLIEQDVDGVPYVINHYDPVSWQLTDTEDHVSHLHYDFDTKTGLPVKITRSAPKTLHPYPDIHYPEGTVILQWSQYGDAIGMVDEEGNRYARVYDDLGRIIEKLVYLRGANKATLLVKTTYDSFSQPMSITTGSGIIKTFAYDRLGRVSASIESKEGKPFQRIEYRYDPDSGHIISTKRSEGSLSTEHDVVSATQDFTYDQTGNLCHMACHATGTGSKNLCPREVDISGSGLKEKPIIVSQDYQFDAWNNISGVIERLIDTHKQKYTKTVRYTYAHPLSDKIYSEMYDPHRMISFDEHWSTQTYNANPHLLTYDKLGRMIIDAEGNQLHYNALGQQDQFINVHNHVVVRYIYDSQGHQIAEQACYGEGPHKGQLLQKTLYMFYNGNQATKQAQKDDYGKMHISEEIGGVAHAEDGMITHWYLYSYKGDVLSTVDNSGRIIESNVYSPYGMKYNCMESHLQQSLNVAQQKPWWQSHEPGFDGQMSDPATGYQFLGGGYRAYNPIYRHFMSKDSLSPFEEIDGYGFVQNNPIMNTDPTGHFSDAVFGSYMGMMMIFMSFTLSMMLPVIQFVTTASIGATSSFMSITGSSICSFTIQSEYMSMLGAFLLSGIGSISGSLQIASIAKPNSQLLNVISNMVNMINPVPFLIGDSTSGTSITRVIKAASSDSTILFFAHLSRATLIFNALLVLCGGVASSTDALSGMPYSTTKQHKKNKIYRVLNIATLVLSVVSVVGSLGAIMICGDHVTDSWNEIKERKRKFDIEMDIINQDSKVVTKFSDLKRFGHLSESSKDNPYIHEGIETADELITEESFGIHINAVYSPLTRIVYIDESIVDKLYTANPNLYDYNASVSELKNLLRQKYEGVKSYKLKKEQNIDFLLISKQQLDKIEQYLSKVQIISALPHPNI